MLTNYSVNEAAAAVIENTVLPNSDFYGVEVKRFSNGGTLLDFGTAENSGSWTLGTLFAEIAMGGLGRVTQSVSAINGLYLPAVHIQTDHPVVAALGCHVGWRIPYAGGTINVQGPIRSLAGKDRFIRKIDYRDTSARRGVAVLQTADPPDGGFFELLAEETGISSKRIYLVAARTGNLTGAVQVCARTVEQTVATISETDFNLDNILSASGHAAIKGISADENEAMGLVNDSLLYGQVTNLFVRCADEEIETILKDLPMNRPKNEKIYGKKFKDLFGMCGNEWVNVPRDWDAPACVNIINTRTGNNFTAGTINAGVMLENWKTV